MAITTIIPNASAQQSSSSYVQNGFTADVTGAQFPLQMGVPLQPNYTFKVIPATYQTDCVAATQTITPNVPMQLRTAAVGTFPNIITRPLTFNGQQGVLLDCERCITIDFGVGSSQATNATITGYDYRGVAISSVLYCPISSTTFEVNIPMTFVTSVTLSSNPGVQVSVGNSGQIGLPYLLTNTQYVSLLSWNGAALATSNIIVGNAWRQSVPIITTANVARGYVDILSNLPNGSRQLICHYYVYGADSEINDELKNQVQSTYKIVQVNTNVSGNYVLPYLVEYDLFGTQYGGDTTFLDSYLKLLAM